MVPDGGGFCAATPDADGIAAEVRRLRNDPDAITRAAEVMVAARPRIEQRTDAVVDVYRSVVAH